MNKSSFFYDRLSREHPDRLAIVSGKESCTYEELKRGIDATSRKLRKMGVRKGSKVGLWSYNSVNWLIAFFSIVRAGGTAVLINYSLVLEDVADLLITAEVEFLLSGMNSQTKKDEKAMLSLAELSGIPAEHCLDIRSSACCLWEAFPEEEDVFFENADVEETSFIIFTTGTTSKPKAVQLSQRALSFDADAVTTNMEGYMGESICIAAPLFHILGLLMSYAYLCRGAKVCFPASNKPDDLIRAIDSQRITDMVAVGAVYMMMEDSKDFEEQVVPHLKLCMIAGGMSTPVQMMRLEISYANATFINMYGQSEGAPLTLVHPDYDVEIRAQTVGKPVEGVDLRILDSAGAFLPQGEIGEVVARGPCLMNGYYKLPEENQAIDREGWLHTGDMGYLDEEGFLHLSGRIKDIIIRGGENMLPLELENAIIRLEGVEDVKVMGAAHPIYGESVEACVIPEKGYVLDLEKLRASLMTMVARFKIPSHFLIYDSFPLNVNGKVDSRSLRADMLTRLRRISVDEELAGGITIYDLKIQNSRYAIVPVTVLAGNLAASVGFGERRVSKIRLAVEEMLTERIMDAYSAAGTIQFRIVLMPEWLRIGFSDKGTEYCIDKRSDTSLSARILLKVVDNFHTEYVDGVPVYCMDFLYEKEFSISDFLMKEEN